MHMAKSLADPRLSKILVVGLFVLVWMLAFSFSKVEPDLWGHVEYGREALRSGLPQTATHTFTAPDFPWINHENLFEIGAAFLVDTMGVAGLLTAKSLLGLLVVGLCVLEARRQKVSWPVTAGSACLLVLGLAHSWPARPQILSYTLYAMLLACLSFAFTGWQGRWLLPWPAAWGRGETARETEHRRSRMRCLWSVPVIMAVWANSHGGFVAGLMLYGSYLAVRAVEAWSIGRSQSIGMLKRLALMALVAVLATFLNPYGPRLQGWIVQAMSMDRPEITEWQPAHWGDETFPVLVILLVVTVAGCVLSRRPLDAAELTLLVLTGVQAVLHIRHLPFFALTMAFSLPRHWQSIWTRWIAPAEDPTTDKTRNDLVLTFSQRMVAHIVASSACFLLGLSLVGRLSQVQVDRATYPVSALEFMHRHHLQGNIVVTYNWAQYVLAAFSKSAGTSEESRVAFDGRLDTCYPAEVIDQHFDFILGIDGPVPRYRDPSSPPANPSAALQQGNPTLVLISRYQPHSVQVMEQNSATWVLLYQDELAQLWGRRGHFDAPQAVHYLPPSRRRISNDLQRGCVPWPAIPPTQVDGDDHPT